MSQKSCPYLYIYYEYWQRLLRHTLNHGLSRKRLCRSKIDTIQFKVGVGKRIGAAVRERIGAGVGKRIGAGVHIHGTYIRG